MRRALHGSSAAARRRAALDFLAARAPGEEVVVVAHGLPAADALVRDAVAARGSVFGWHRLTFAQLVGRLALPTLAARGLTPVAGLALEAICAPALHVLGAGGGLGRFAEVARRPGMPRALVATSAELAACGVTPAALAAHDPDLAALYAAYREALAAAGLTDRAGTLEVAAESARAEDQPFRGMPLVVLDVPLRSPAEVAVLEAMASRAGEVLCVMPRGDATVARVGRALGVRPEALPEEPPAEPRALDRLRVGLFAERRAGGDLDESVTFLSAAGEGRECVEIARVVADEAARGTPFERIAVLLRAPCAYRELLVDTLRRARIPAAHSQGALRPDPTGRALLALLACRAEGYSARAFAEYLSLGVVPEVASSAPDAAPEGWLPPDESLFPFAAAPPGAPPDDDEDLARAREATRAPAGSLRAPRRWEKLLHEAAVIGGRDRWARRLDGLEEELRLDLADLEDPDAPRAQGIARDLAHLAAFRAFALPLLDRLAALPARATWGEWTVELADLARQSLRDPERVASVLAELAPMADIGPVDLAEVRLVLAPRLSDLLERPGAAVGGKVFVGAIDDARGLDFDVVVVPGLAEKVFPARVSADPLLPDALRAALDPSLAVQATRVAEERLLLRLAVGAARRRLVLTYPRVDQERARPRVPSFYGLEVLHAVEGKLSGFAHLDAVARAHEVAHTRHGWPAPTDPQMAIDAAEYDLAVLGRLVHGPASGRRGAAAYLLAANDHLARALRFRGRRFTLATWHKVDGLTQLSDEAKAALAAHRLAARPYSATALEKFAACPYRFYLYAIARLAPREVPAPIEELDPLSRGSLIHDVQFELLGRLRDDGLLPVDDDERLVRARGALDEVLARVAARYEEKLAPAVPAVWAEGVTQIRADLSRWLFEMQKSSRWVPLWFELGFGMPDARSRDPRSLREPVPLDCGIQLRGAIDLVEENDGRLRATDHKTGRASAPKGVIIGGGKTLQPVLYALALEKATPERVVEGGRLYYCTSRGKYWDRNVRLDDDARGAADLFARTVDSHLERGFLPAAPEKGGCTYCDYRDVCGPYEEIRVKRKKPEPLAPLERLRRHQ